MARYKADLLSAHFLLRLTILSLAFAGASWAQCNAPPNPIVAENCLPGNPRADWDISGIGDETIQGFATDISVNAGQTVFFKINTNATSYRLEIFRLGYYGGLGARKVATVNPSVPLPQNQPACLSDPTTKLVDCGNWSVSASWAVPSTAVSGVYIALLTRLDTGGQSHILFVVRKDSSNSSILVQTSDTTWQAYNSYGGFSLYGDNNNYNLPNRATKVSYNRPFSTRVFSYYSWLFNAEYPMIRWLEANGYDVTYFTGVDAARRGHLIRNHKIYISSGHDEYWSAEQRTNVEAARDAGVNLAFFSGNEVFWKTRWENAIDGSGTPYRTLVCYKETLADAKIDPTPVWTGTWRDPRFSPPADGGKPENSLTGTIFLVNGPGPDNNNNLSIEVPSAEGKMRFWRNTSIATLPSGQKATLPAGTLGYEWDGELDNGFRPPGLIRLSQTTHVMTVDLLLDHGKTYGAGPVTHHMTLYRAPSGALVFGAGTVQWAWGLDDNTEYFFYGVETDVRMQQATVNLFADMGVQPATLQPGLIPATKSTDSAPPVSTILAPAQGSSIPSGVPRTITGTATDFGGGVVGGVEVSVDGGATWHPATGRASWSYNWTPGVLGSVTIRARAVDDSGNIEVSPAAVTVTVVPPTCPCSLWNNSPTPSLPDSGDPYPVEVGISFRTDFDGYLTGIRFYKGAGNVGTHVGHVWSGNGTLLASVTFTGESATGWQQANFSSPIPVTANTNYVASYFAPAGHYALDYQYFGAGYDRPPLHAISVNNGVYAYSSTSTFPTSSYNSSNYWVDVVYIPAGPMPGGSPSLLAYPTSLAFKGYAGQPAPPAKTVSIYNQGTGSLNWTSTKSASWISVSPSAGSVPATMSISANPAGLANGTYNGTVTITPTSGGGPPQVISVTLTVTTLLSSSTFDTGIDGWALSPLGLGQNWSVANQVLQYNGGGHTQLYTGNSAWTDYTFEADIKLSSVVNYPGGIRGRVNPATGSGYAVWLYPGNGLLRLYRVNTWNIDAGFTTLGEATVAFDSLNFHKVGMTFLGSQIQVFYDGALVVTATDATYPSGMVALDVSNRPISYDNVLVTTSGAVGTATIAASPSSLSFNGSYGGSNPQSQSIQIAANGTPGALTWSAASTVPWLTITSGSGLTPGSMQVSANIAGLNPGTYNGAVLVNAPAASNHPQSIGVTLTIVASPPSIAVSSSSLGFLATLGQPAPAPRTLSVTNGGFYGSFSFTAVSNASWLSVTPGSGSTPSTLSVSVNPAGLSAGSYTGQVTITAPGIANSPVVIPVTMAVFTQSLTENFASGANGWVISPMGNSSGWTAASGTYAYNGAGLSQSCTGNSAWTDYTFSAKVKLSTLVNWPGGLRGRVNPATGAGYVVWMYPTQGTMILYRVPQWNIDGPGLVALAQAPMTFDATSFHDLQMVFLGSQISVYWDGAFVLGANDTTYSGGYACLDTAHQPISFQDIRVNSTRSRPTLAASPANLTFSAVATIPPAQDVTLTAGGEATAWSLVSSNTWLTATQSSAIAPGTITVSVNPAGLPKGTYNGTLTVFAPGATNSPLVIPVTFAVTNAVLSTTPASLTFFGATDYNPPAKAISITNAGTGTLNWSATASQTWIGLSAPSGTAPDSLLVSPAANTLLPGQYTGNVTINSPDVANGPATIPVTLQVGTSLLFSDSFTAGAGNWSASPLGNAAGWSVVNNSYQYNGAGHTQQFAGSSSWSDYTVSIDFRLFSLNNWPGGIRGRVNPSTGASYGVWVYPAQGVLKLFRIGQWNIDADLTQLGQSEFIAMDATNLHNLRLSFQGSQIKVYYDDALVITATDSSYSQGGVALDVSNQPVAFTNVRVIGF